MSKNQQSCHPRVVNGRTKYPKVNTAKPRREGIAPEKIARMLKHFEQYPNDKMTADRPVKNGTAWPLHDLCRPAGHLRSLNDERGTGGQSKLARLLDWHHSTVWRKLSSKSPITESNAVAILKAMEMAEGR
jgi:hypothetical protein